MEDSEETERMGRSTERDRVQTCLSLQLHHHLISSRRHRRGLCLHQHFPSDSCLTGVLDCPVMIYFHGGSLSFTAVMFNTTFLAEQYVSKDIIFAIPSFRLGSLGVLHFENKTLIPRNLPLYVPDIIQGLHYIHEEIHNFGGNSSCVTLMGHSMGSCLALALAFAPNLDPGAELFQQMISLSGPLYYQTAKSHLDNSRMILEKAGVGKTER